MVLLDRYRVVSKLGAGGMGTVYLAEHSTIGKRCAIKVLSSQYAHRADLVQRFLTEARAASMIPQQNIVEITDFGATPDNSVCFVMEYLEGEDLGALVKREGPLPWDRVRHLVLQICRALDAAHAAGIIHRDMKPENCFRIRREKDEDFIKVLDFGIAKVQSGEQIGPGLTQTGMIFGTPEYMSPEQAQGEHVDHRVDIYALGVIMFELLVGRVPFTGGTFMGILSKQMFDVPPRPSDVAPDAGIPAEAEAIVLKAMQKDADYRFQTMAQMIAAIEAVGTGAGPVEIVPESVARPTGGPTNFAGATTGAPALVPADTEDRNRSGWRAAGGLLLAVLAIVYLSLRGPTQFEADPDPAADPAAEPEADPADEPAVEPDPQLNPEVGAVEPPIQPEPAATVSVLIATNVPAQILDARDRAVYGSTDSTGQRTAGIELERSDEPLQLILSAEGYDELAIEVLPDGDSKKYQYELVAVEAGADAKPTKTKRPHSPTPEPKAASEQPKASNHQLPTKGANDGDVKNPFIK
ncbi:Serine/threonine protein kinase PrkC, regulator of stationary phase [Enhygromyxa salina]|uniref:non-specific serine/threonine protein kinase n=1 Tax=Enhygromyxa salina TaxID=215803 RepID=A0A0C2CY06_9BACT|nr:Serine/threonine protein kinase PrkC, regulator of stationary phase [Enhygromyxa salina]